MTKPARFSQADVTRAVKAAANANLCVAGVKIEPDGSIVILTGTGEGAQARRNPLDRLLDR